jgi:hypothetical protein
MTQYVIGAARSQKRSWIADTVRASRDYGVNIQKSNAAFGPRPSRPLVGTGSGADRVPAEHRGATTRSAACTAAFATGTRLPHFGTAAPAATTT